MYPTVLSYVLRVIKKQKYTPPELPFFGHLDLNSRLSDLKKARFKLFPALASSLLSITCLAAKVAALSFMKGFHTMKHVNIALSLLGLISSAHAMASQLTIKPQVSYLQSKSQVDQLKASDGSIIDQTDSSDDKARGAIGAAVAAEYSLLEQLRLGGSLGYNQYEKTDEDVTSSDIVLRGGVAYDLLKQDNVSVFTTAGLSYHILSEDDRAGIKADSFNLLNYDIGVGGRYQVAENVALGLEYRFTDTLVAQDTTIRTTNTFTDQEDKITAKGTKLQSNEMIASVSFAL